MRTTSTDGRRHRRRLGLLAVAAVAGAGVFGVRAVTGGGEPEREPTVAVQALPAANPASAADAGAAPAAGPAGREWGVPVGYVRTPAGARTAAVGWVSSLGALMEMGPIARNDTLRALLTEQAAVETIEEFRGERDRWVRRFSMDPAAATWLESPLTVQLDAFDESAATVRVWSQLLVAVDGDRVGAMWRTHAVTLVWEHDDWRVDDVTHTPGPTPTPMHGELPSTPDELIGPMEWTGAVVAGVDDGADG